MPRKPCNYPGCPLLINSVERHCDKHRKLQNKDKERGRKTAHQRGYTSRWRKAARAYLERNALCRLHMERGEVVAATVVDHIIPHRGDQRIFWQKTNWQSLCKPCHDHKTATEDGGFTGWSQGEGRVKSSRVLTLETDAEDKFFYPRNSKKIGRAICQEEDPQNPPSKKR